MNRLVQFLKNNLLQGSAATPFRNLCVVGSFIIILWQIFSQVLEHDVHVLYNAHYAQTIHISAE